MRSQAFITDQLMFGELLAYLRQHGFSIGVDHYLRLQQLLNKIRGHCGPRELRTLLCPIFATNKLQQENFYRAFDSYFELFQISDEDEELSESAAASVQEHSLNFKANTSRRRWFYAVVPVGFAAILFLAFLIFSPPTSEPIGNRATSNLAPDARTEIPNKVADNATTSAGARVEVTEIPVQPNDLLLATPSPTPLPAPTFYERNRTAVHVAIILSPLVIFLLYEWYRFARRKLLVQKEHSRRPPFVWPVRVDAPEEGLYDSEQFLTAARLLRRRQMDEFLRLDVEATVSATIERLGFPEFRYKSDSRVPEYLILIDRASYRDHQARLFEELTKALEREGVFVVRYFFDGDPRVCRDEAGAGVVQLAELENKYADHRLLIFGDGRDLLDQITGRLDSWTAIFNHWQDRALLTVESPSQWGLREISLAQLFIVLPATLNGLLALVDYFETTVPADLREWMQGSSGPAGIQSTPEEQVGELRGLLGAEAFEWLCACAVYTELQWNLTLFIGSLPSMPPGLVTEANLLKLIRLPWFRVGAIPDEVRWLLINSLAPAQQQAVRAALIELLERDPAPLETFANDQYRLNLSAQRWLQSRTRKRLRELLQTIKQLPRNQVLRDLTLIRFLESASRSPLDFLLPDRLRKLFYHRGVPAFGMKTGARFLVALFFIGVAWIGTSALAPTQRLTLPDSVARNFGDPLAEELDRLRNDPQAIEAAARERSKIVRPDEIIVPIISDTKPPQSTAGNPIGATPAARTLPEAGRTLPPGPSTPPLLTIDPSLLRDMEVFGDPAPAREPTTSTSQTGSNVSGVGDGKGPEIAPGGNVNNNASDVKTDKPEDYTRVFNASEVSKKAVLTLKPEPMMTEIARNNGTSGVVKLRVVLAADGRVTNITVIQALRDGLTEQAIQAASRIKFVPAQKDGHPVSQFQPMDYRFVLGTGIDNGFPPNPRGNPNQNPGRQPRPGGRNP